MGSPDNSIKPSSSSEGSSLASNDLSIELSSQSQKYTCSSRGDKFHGQPDSAIKWQIRELTAKIGLNRGYLFNIFKWSLIAFNGVLIFAVLIGMFAYFSEIREKTKSHFERVEEETFSNDFNGQNSSGKVMSSGPKYAWIVSMFTFAFLLVVPCVGLIGAIKEQSCLLILYGVIFFVNALVVLIFKSPWFLISASIASASLGLVFLIRRATQSDSSHGINSNNVIKWHVSAV